MSFLSRTLGLVNPKYKTVSDWVKIYEEILAAEDICEKTLSNRKNHVKKIVEEFGDTSIGLLKPHIIAQFIAKLTKKYPVTAKRTLIELRCMLNHALLNGWIPVNPAMSVKPPRTKVERLRLSFEDWKKTYDWSKENQPGWVSRMLLLALVTGQRRGDLISMTLLGHSKQQMTDLYNDDRGLDAKSGKWKTLELVG